MSLDGWNKLQEAVDLWLEELKSLPPSAVAAPPLPPSHRSRSIRRGRGKSPRSLALIDAAAEVLEQIQPASIRAVCYRLFTLGIIRSMSKGETNRVSTQLTWARENSIIPWHWVVDETRAPERISAWDDPDAFVETIRRSYRRDRWVDQPEWLEVWSEKGTIRGTLAPVLHEYGITFRVMHGYGSATALHEIADETQRIKRPLTVFYVGDWDPSGLHMSAVDLPSRLERYGGTATIVRIALTADDVSGDLPWFPAESKSRDSRYRWFSERWGAKCWELDALNPVILRERTRRLIQARIEPEAWDRAATAERAETESLSSILNAWPGVRRLASNSGQDSEC
jgi:hypothetical protein